MQTILIMLVVSQAKVEIPPAGSPNAALQVAYLDLRSIYLEDERRGPLGQDAPYMRYFWVNSEQVHRNSFLVIFCVHLNKLSILGKLRWPSFVCPDVVRIDIRDYGWDTNGVSLVHEKTADLDPVFHQVATVKEDIKLYRAWPVPGSKKYEPGMYGTRFKKGDKVALPAVWVDNKTADKMRYMACSESPILNAEWWFAQTARQTNIFNVDEPGIGYYDYLALKNRDDFFKLTGTDVKTARRLFRTWSAVVIDSGISEQNRQVVRFGAVSDFVWGTLDTFTQKEKGVLQRNLRDGEYLHDAEEWFGRLPNGLDVTFLGNAKGQRQSTAPDKIGPDRSKLNLKNEGNDFRVHTNLSCIRCHGASDLLKDVDDWARDTFKQGGPLSLTDPDKRVALELESEYLRDINKLLKKDRGDYADAIKEATTSKLNPKGLTCAEFAEQYSDAWDRYGKIRVTPDIAARELGVPKQKLIAGIRAHASKINRGQGDLVLSTWLVNDRGIKRTTWEDTYALAMSLSLGLSPPETVEERKVQRNFEQEKKK